MSQPPSSAAFGEGPPTRKAFSLVPHSSWKYQGITATAPQSYHALQGIRCGAVGDRPANTLPNGRRSFDGACLLPTCRSGATRTSLLRETIETKGSRRRLGATSFTLGDLLAPQDRGSPETLPWYLARNSERKRDQRCGSAPVPRDGGHLRSQAVPCHAHHEKISVTATGFHAPPGASCPALPGEPRLPSTSSAVP